MKHWWGLEGLKDDDQSVQVSGVVKTVSLAEGDYAVTGLMVDISLHWMA